MTITREELEASRAELVRGGDLLPPVHPGEILQEEFLKPLGLTAYALAKRMRVPQTRLAAILAGRRGITADTAIRLGRVFGTTAEFWLGLQAAHDLEVERRKGTGAEVEALAA